MMYVKKFLLIITLIPGILMAMERPTHSREKSYTLDELRAMHLELQKLRLLNTQRNLPTFECSIKLFDPSKISEITNKYPHSNRDYRAEPDKKGEYVLESIASSSCYLEYNPVITRVRIDPEQPSHALINYRMTNDQEENSTHQASDLILSIPYASPRIFDVEVYDNNQTISQRLALGILIEKTTSTHLIEEMAIANAIIAQDSA